MNVEERNAAYDVRTAIGEAAFSALMAEYRQRSREAVSGLAGTLGIVYDPVSRERLDVWGIGSAPRPAFVYLHGGYWRALGRHDSAFMAASLARLGIATVAVDYTLVPHASLAEIVRQARAAVAWVRNYGADHGLDPGRIVVGGSSAGGHLAAMTAVGAGADAVGGVLAISGLYDLRPLLGTFVEGWMRWDSVTAWELSPLADVPGAMPVVAAVPDGDGAGFRWQAETLASAWAGRPGAPVEVLPVPGRNHYDVVFDLADPDTELSERLRQLVAGTQA